MLTPATALTPAELTSAIVLNPLMVAPDITVMEAIAQMSGVRTICSTSKTADSQLDELHVEARSSCVLIVQDRQLLGILTERDIVRLSTQKRSLDSVPIREAMTSGVVTIGVSAFTDLFLALNLLQQYQIRHLPVLDDQNRVVGMLTHESLRQTSRPVDLLRLRLVVEVMTSEVICANPDVSMMNIAELMAQNRVSSVMIVEEQIGSDRQKQQIPIGIVTERDIVQFQALNLNLETCLAKSVMSTPIFAVSSEDSLWTVQQIMEQRLVRRLAVTGKAGELLGIITQTSILQALNPIEVYKLAEILEKKVLRLEAEKVALLENRNIELEQQVENRTATLKAESEQKQLIATIASQIRASLDLTEILNTTVTEVRSLLNCDRADIWQFQADASVIVVVESVADKQIANQSKYIHDNCLDWRGKWRTGVIRVVDDIYTAPISDCHRQLLEDLEIRAKILVPIFQAETLWGLLCVAESRTPRHWQTTEITLLQQLATQLEIAIQQGTAYQQVQSELAERQRVEAHLRESEKRFAALAQSAPVGIFRTDTSGNCLFVNDRWCEIAGLTSDEALGKGWIQGLYPEDRDRISAEWYQSAQEHRPFKLEYRFGRSDGTFSWVFGQASAERDEDGQIVGYIGTITDISDRKRAEEALSQLNQELEQRVEQRTLEVHRSESRLQEAQHIARLGHWEIDFAESKITGSPEIFEILGLEIHHQELTFEQLRQHFHPSDWAYHRKTIKGVIQLGGKHYEIDQQIIRSDGSLGWIFAKGQTVYNAEGQLVRLFGIVMDISDRKLAETELAKSEEKFRCLVEGIDDLIWSCDREGKLTYLSPQFKILFGWEPEAWIGQSFSLLVHPDDRDWVVADAQRMVVTSEKLQAQEFRHLHQDGGYIWVLCNATPLKNAEGMVIQFQGILRDISDRKLAEEQLRQQKETLQTIFDRIPLMIGLFSATGETVMINPEMERLIGWHQEEYNQIDVLASCYPNVDDYRKVVAHMIRADSSWQDFETQVRDGRKLITSWSQIRLSNGSSIGLGQDITERFLAEEALRESKQFLQTVLNTFPLGVFWKNREFVFLGCNLYFSQVGGLASPEEILGKTDEDFDWGLREAVFHRTDDAEVMESGVAQLGIIKTMLQADGSTIWLEINKIPLRNIKGEIVGLLGTFQDITHRKLAEIRLEQQAEQERILTFITQRIRASLNLKEILNTAVAEVRQILKVDRVLIYRVYPSGTGAAIAESVAPHWLKLLNINFPEEIFPKENYQRYLDGRIFALSDRETGSILPCLVDFLRQIKVRAKLVLPIVDKQELWGLLIAHQCEDSRDWQNWEIDLMKQLSNQLSIAIQQSNLYQQLQLELKERQAKDLVIHRQVKMESLLREITQRIRDSLDLQTIFARATEDTRHLIDADRVGIFQFASTSNFNEGEFVAESVVAGFDSVMATKIHDHCFGEQYAVYYHQGRIQKVSDIYDSGLTECHINILAQFQVRANLAVPLLDGSNLWGLLCIHQCSRPRYWRESEINLVKQIANQLAIGIQQANLFDQLQTELQERQQAETKLTEINQQLAISNQELARATRLKDEFLANMSHELRTPLNAILGMTEALQDEIFGAINERQIRALQTVEHSGNHLLSLINDILDLAKIESGQVELNCSPTAVDSLCQSSLTLVKQQALQKRIQLQVKIPANLPEIVVDERRIRQVLINLLNNAIKFTPEGGSVILEVTIEPSEILPTQANYPTTASSIRFAVRDTGIGITAENIQKLFQPFVQIDSALNRQYMGTGLGLSLVKRMVSMHGGTVLVTSEVGVGSCFSFDIPAGNLPLLVSESGDAKRPNLEDNLREKVAVTTSPLLLLVDDNPANVNTISGYLKAKGYQMLVARNIAEAIALTKSSIPDLMMMDIQMPGMDAVDAIGQIRSDRQFANIPIIVLTTLAMARDGERCLQAGANHYLTKPVKLKQLVSTIQDLLASSLKYQI
ncbi:PAS domain S-box protein [Microcoleus sp. EPA2]|uniref:PAS domain S-box protein n=1 Tax=Microcoleus sp. EPA2 TaxID=2841654 RepID=UPI00312BAAB8